MESLDTAAFVIDDLLDFSSDIGEEEDDEDKSLSKASSLNHNNTGLDSGSFDVLEPLDPSRPFPEFQEEELEWISNKELFPSVETFVDILCNPVSKQQSPVSVLENSNCTSSTSTNSSTISNNNGCIFTNFCSNLRVPVRARSQRRRSRRRDLQNQEPWWYVKNVKPPAVPKVVLGRKCQHCGAEKTPQWRAGPCGPKTLCNACGVRYKSGRLVPEYRPASSPTFSSELHSNSHRKVLEMRKQKMTGMEMCLGMVKPVDKG